MKIEKINDNQIRCTLTSEDLASRQIKLSELAYGTEKAKDLFRDMMQMAHRDFGFEADNIPLMIEAIPVNPDSIILIITNVEDPEELDTRFSKFSQGSDASLDLPEEPSVSGADDIIDIFQKLYEAKMKSKNDKKEDVKKEDTPKSQSSDGEEPKVELIHQFSFSTLDDVIGASHALGGYFTGDNTLYKLTGHGGYVLILHQSGYSPEEFNKVCNVLSEYGRGQTFSPAGEAHLSEHHEVIIGGEALQQLAQV